MRPGGWSVINDPLPSQHKRELLDWGLDTTNSPMVHGAPGYGFYPTQDPPGSDDPARPESAVPNNGKVENPVLFPHSPCFGSHFDVIVLMYLVSSGFSSKPLSSSSGQS